MKVTWEVILTFFEWIVTESAFYIDCQVFCLVRYKLFIPVITKQ